MAANQKKRPSKKKQPSRVTKPDDRKDPSAATPTAPQALPYQPGISPGSVDVIGIVPEDVHVDPYITEGHPGYEESGDSELHPDR